MSGSFPVANPAERKKTTILITGGAGFIGSHLVDHFMGEGYRVLCLDNFLTGKKENISHHFNNPQFQLIEHDLSKPFFPEASHDPIAAILHFASPASPFDYLEFPIQTLKVGALGTHHALGIAKSRGARLLLASTSEVYGDPLQHPQREDYWGNVNPIGPRGVYDEAKRFAEAMTMAYHRVHKVDTKIVRIFNTYGPRMRLKDGRAVPAFIDQACSGKEVTVFGDGQQTRSFCFVSDLVDGIVRLLASDFHEPVNLGNPHEMTIQALAEEICRRVGTKSKIIHQALPADDPKVRRPDITRAKKPLGWEPRVSFDAGLALTLKYFQRDSGKGVERR